jgi:hypothetical protein
MKTRTWSIAPNGFRSILLKVGKNNFEDNVSIYSYQEISHFKFLAIETKYCDIAISLKLG